MGVLASGPAPLPGFLNSLAGPLNHYGYWLILVLVTLEDFGVPVPGETVIIAAAVLAGHGQLNVVAVGVIAFVAAVTGDNIGFAIGHFGGRAVAVRWGRYVFLTEERLDKAAAFFDRQGGKIIVVARFIEGLRQANGIIAGISGMHWRRFVVYNMLGAALWVGTWVSVGYLAGSHIDTIYHYIGLYSYYVLIAAAVLLAGYITWRVLRRRSRKRHASEAREQPAVQENSAADGTSGVQGSSAVRQNAALDSAAVEENHTPLDSAAVEENHTAPGSAAVEENHTTPGSAAVEENHTAPDSAAVEENHTAPASPAGQGGGVQGNHAAQEDPRRQEPSNTQGS